MFKDQEQSPHKKNNNKNKKMGSSTFINVQVSGGPESSVEEKLT